MRRGGLPTAHVSKPRDRYGTPWRDCGSLAGGSTPPGSPRAQPQLRGSLARRATLLSVLRRLPPLFGQDRPFPDELLRIVIGEARRRLGARAMRIPPGP